MRILTIITTLIACLLPFSGVYLTDREVFYLLLEESHVIARFPFHVYIMPDYEGFKGAPLPVSSYAFFAPFYEELKVSSQPDQILAPYQFSQGTRWKCFLLRVPNMYDSNAISLWIFDKEQNTWQKPLKIAESWGDAGYSIRMQAWIEDVNKDSWFDIAVRTLETDLLDPKNPTTNKRKDTVFIWDKDHFNDASREYLPKMNLSEYRFKEYTYQGEE